MNIYGNFVKLRAMEYEDQEFLREMINDPEIEEMVGGHSFPVSKDQQIHWYNHNKNNNNNLRLIIETENEGTVGFANLVNIDWKNRSAFHGIKIANKNLRSRGIGTDTVMAIMRYAFEELQLNRIETTIIGYNEPSIHLYKNKCGWTIEGTRRNSIYKNNSFHDELYLAILKNDYHLSMTSYWDEQN